MKALLVFSSVAVLALSTSVSAFLEKPAERSHHSAAANAKAGDRIHPGNAAEAGESCAGINFTRSLQYGAAERNVLDVAHSQFDDHSLPRPVVLFVAGESFTEPAASGGIAALLDQAMCLAARNNLVAVRMSYRLAPAHPWPAGARDVAAAVSWVRDNVDLFRGDRNAIVAIGYSVGAFHLASSLAHQELRVQNSVLAGVVLVSGLYRIGTHSSAAVKAYIGNDPRNYPGRSIFPGILFVNTPVLLAWSVHDPDHVLSESEELNRLICEARRGFCPRTAILQSQGSLTTVLDLLGEPILSLVREIEARGLP